MLSNAGFLPNAALEVILGLNEGLFFFKEESVGVEQHRKIDSGGGMALVLNFCYCMAIFNEKSSSRSC